MAEKVVFKMFFIIFFVLFISNALFSVVAADKMDKCSCHSICSKNFATNSTDDIHGKKIAACQRGCRFYSLILHLSREQDEVVKTKNAKEDCLLSCSEGYLILEERPACQFGCSAVERSKVFCIEMDTQKPVLIHPGEPEPDDFLTDPGLREQIRRVEYGRGEQTRANPMLTEDAPLIPEIRFRNLPVKGERASEPSQTNVYPKYFEAHSTLEYGYWKLNKDLVVFSLVIFLIVGAFLVSHQMDTINLTQLLRRDLEWEDSKLYKVNYESAEKESFEDVEIGEMK